MINASDIINGWGLLEYNPTTKLIEITKESQYFEERDFHSEMYLMQSVIRRLAGKPQILDFRNNNNK